MVAAVERERVAAGARMKVAAGAREKVLPEMEKGWLAAGPRKSWVVAEAASCKGTRRPHLYGWTASCCKWAYHAQQAAYLAGVVCTNGRLGGPSPIALLAKA